MREVDSFMNEQETRIMADNQLVILARAFAVDIIHLCDAMKTRGKATGISSPP